jgi:hypothetical protein
MNEKFFICVKKLHATALFLTLLDRFKNYIFYERKRMKKLALFLTDVKKSHKGTYGSSILIIKLDFNDTKTR